MGTLGGRAAEQVMLGKISTGAQNDLQRVTQMAYNKVAVYGMNDKVGLLSFPKDQNELTKPYGNETATLIDEEVRDYVSKLYEKTINLLEEKRDVVEALAQQLLQKEVLNLEELTEVMGKRPFQSEELRNIDKLQMGFQGEKKPEVNKDEKQAEKTIAEESQSGEEKV